MLIDFKIKLGHLDENKTFNKKTYLKKCGVKNIRDSRNMKFNSQPSHSLLGNTRKAGRYGIQTLEAFVNF